MLYILFKLVFLVASYSLRLILSTTKLMFRGIVKGFSQGSTFSKCSTFNKSRSQSIYPILEPGFWVAFIILHSHIAIFPIVSYYKLNYLSLYLIICRADLTNKVSCNSGNTLYSFPNDSYQPFMTLEHLKYDYWYYDMTF